MTATLVLTTLVLATLVLATLVSATLDHRGDRHQLDFALAAHENHQEPRGRQGTRRRSTAHRRPVAIITAIKCHGNSTQTGGVPGMYRVYNTQSAQDRIRIALSFCVTTSRIAHAQKATLPINLSLIHI